MTAPAQVSVALYGLMGNEKSSDEESGEPLVENSETAALKKQKNKEKLVRKIKKGVGV